MPLEQITFACTGESTKVLSMHPYSQDLRERIVQALQAQEDSQAEIAERFAVSRSFVEKLWRRWRTTGQGAALPHAGGRQRSLQGAEGVVRRAVAQQPDRTLAELCTRVVQAGGVRVSPKTMCLELQRLRLPRKKSLSMRGNATRPA